MSPALRIGASFEPHWLADLGVVREAAQAFDEAGIDHATIGGHLLSAAEGRYPDSTIARYALPYRDPFVLFSALAATTRRLRFRSSILILPLYPTALVARQAADLSLLSDGRFELGVGVSWQAAEYAALGQDMRLRGSRIEEQIEVLRRFWSEPLVTFRGRFHDIDGLGLLTLPPAPIPILIGCGTDERLLRRAARLGDGWIASLPEPSAATSQTLRGLLRESGRAEESFEIVARLYAEPGAPDAWIEEGRRLAAAGATQISVSAPPGAEPQRGLELILAAAAALTAL